MNDGHATATEWHGEHAFGDGWFAFRGRAADNAPHAHAALQLTAARHGHVRLTCEDGTVFRGPGFAVAPGVGHRLLPCSDAVLVLIEPDANAAKRLRPSRTIAPLRTALRDELVRDGSLGQVVGDALAFEARTDGDQRLRAALGGLASSEHGNLASLARSVGLSEARLRALAKRDLGVPLTKVAGYQRLTRAAEAIAGGASLAEAAAEAGFADQAHLTRVFKATVGLTPGKASRSLR